jgi:hypothetical protein
MDKKELTKLVSSFVIGDGTLSNLKRYPVNGKYKENKEKNSKYSIKQLSIHKDYIDWQTEILENLTRVRATIIPEHVDNRGYTSHEMISLVTMRHPFYTKMRNNCYLDNRKTINPHFLKLWDAQSLATLYMDDGWLEKKINKNVSVNQRIGITTHSHT